MNRRSIIGFTLIVAITVGCVLYYVYLTLASVTLTPSSRDGSKETHSATTSLEQFATTTLRDGKIWDMKHGTTSTCYFVKDNQVFYLSQYGDSNTDTPKKVSDSPNTFVVLYEDFCMEKSFAKDKDHLYQEEKVFPLAGVDLSTIYGLSFSTMPVLADKNNIYYGNRLDKAKIPSGVDAMLFESAIPAFIYKHTFLKNNGKLYIISYDDGLVLIPNGDPSTLEMMPQPFDSDVYFKDKNNIYCGGKIATQVKDRATFKDVGDMFDYRDPEIKDLIAEVVFYDKYNYYDRHCNFVAKRPVWSIRDNLLKNNDIELSFASSSTKKWGTYQDKDMQIELKVSPSYYIVNSYGRMVPGSGGPNDVSVAYPNGPNVSITISNISNMGGDWLSSSIDVVYDMNPKNLSFIPFVKAALPSAGYDTSDCLPTKIANKEAIFCSHYFDKPGGSLWYGNMIFLQHGDKMLRFVSRSKTATDPIHEYLLQMLTTLKFF